MICIYHSRDLDGWMSAAIVKLRYPNVELIGWDYGQPIPDLRFKEVIMVDISFPKEVMKENANRITWIDHHASAIKDSIEGFYKLATGLRDPKFAACELTWAFFFPMEPLPEIVRLLGRYDCFGHKGTDEEQKVLEFQYGARTVISNPEEAYKYLVDGHTDWILQAGKSIYQYLCAEAKQIYARRFAFRIWDVKIALVNQERFNPINFGIDYHKDGYDVFGCFHYAKGMWNFSLYNDNGKVDVSEIAKARGGGGHKGAAGFITHDIGWYTEEVDE
jgi:uncharacterized protein